MDFGPICINSYKITSIRQHVKTEFKQKTIFIENLTRHCFYHKIYNFAINDLINLCFTFEKMYIYFP